MRINPESLNFDKDDHFIKDRYGSYYVKVCCPVEPNEIRRIYKRNGSFTDVIIMDNLGEQFDKYKQRKMALCSYTSVDKFIK